MFDRIFLQRAAFCCMLFHACACTIAADELPPLENLLRQLDHVDGATVSAEQIQNTQELRESLEQIIQKRNRVVLQNGGFFPLLMQSREKFVEMQRADARLAEARAMLDAATAQMAQQQQLWAMINKEPLSFANARAFLNQATANLRQADAGWQGASTVLNQHVARVREQGLAFFREYTSLRSTLPHRRDAANETIAAVLSQWRGQSPDFIDGDVVAAIALAYCGKDTAATTLLEDAEKTFDRFPPLLDTALAEDCYAAWLLLGRLDKVGPFVGKIDRMNVNLRTAAQQWLSAAHAAMRGQASEAHNKYKLAIKKAKADVPPALRAEAAIAAIDGLDARQGIRRAKDYLEGLTDDTQWTVLRAKATLAAAEGEWEKAVMLMDQAKPLAPACMEDEFEQQCDAYQQGKSWSAKTSR